MNREIKKPSQKERIGELLVKNFKDTEKKFDLRYLGAKQGVRRMECIDKAIEDISERIQDELKHEKLTIDGQRFVVEMTKALAELVSARGKTH